MIKIENVIFKYKNTDDILRNINLTINEGEVVSIIGRNGSGKSTLAKLMARVIKAY